jgi:hypothetical protein
LLAEEKKLHVVEFRKENDYFPNVVASPTTCNQDEIKLNEVTDYTQVMCHEEINFKNWKHVPSNNNQNIIELPCLKIKFVFRKLYTPTACGVVVRVPGYRSRGLGSIPSATRFSKE